MGIPGAFATWIIEPHRASNHPGRWCDSVAASADAGSQVRDLEWSRGRELNPRPTDYESVALPLSYPGVCSKSLTFPKHLRIASATALGHEGKSSPLFDGSDAGTSRTIGPKRSRKKAQGPPDPYPQRFGPARCTPPCVSHQCRTASCEEPDSVHAPFAYSPPAREQVAAEPAHAATPRRVTTRAATVPMRALAHFLSTGGCCSSP